MNSDLIQLGMIVGIINGAFELAKYAISRATGNGSRGIQDNLKRIETNHIHELKDVLNRVDRRTEEINIHLIEIKQILKK